MTVERKTKAKTRSAKGKVKEATGRATGDRVLRDKGKGNQVSGDMEQAGQKVKDAFKH